MDVTHQVPSGLKYTKTHEWLRLESDGSLTVGITSHAQHLLGDVVYVELPALDKTITAGGETAVVESVKAASDVYSPIAGKIMAVNDALSSQPELINQSPYEAGWIFRLMPDNAQAWESHSALLTHDAYLKQIESDS